jgi:hypothetical protein
MSPWFVAAYTSWTTGFEATPSGSDSVSQGDDRIRELKENTRNRLNMEHWWDVSTNNQGHHREGSANTWYRAPCPTADLTANPDGSASTYGTPDVGKLCINSTDQSMVVWNGSAFVAAVTTLFGNSLAHYGAGVAPVDSYDPTKFAIRGVYNDSTLDTAGCLSAGHFQTTALASQTFGDAGVACFSTGTVNLTGRSTTSRGIIVAQLNALQTGGTTINCKFAVYRDAQANQVGPVTAFNALNTVTWNSGMMYTYVTGLSAGSHEFAMSVQSVTSGGQDCDDVADPNGGSLTYIDLGPEYP